MDKPKYNSKKIEIDGHIFDSKDESLFYLLLKKRKEYGAIIDFELQPKYVLIPKHKYFDKNIRETTYTADFLVHLINCTDIVIDVKGFGTQQGDIRRKLFGYMNPNIRLKWITRNIKYGDKDGWVDYDELKKIRSKNKSEKKKYDKYV
jgi:hypothetical protein